MTIYVDGDVKPYSLTDSLCQSVTLVYCIHMAEDIVRLLSQPGRAIILVFDPQFQGNPFSGGAKYMGWEKFQIFD